MEQKYTPMMMQYLEIKKQYPDTIVMYRLGDFYEMFFDDAKTASKELEIALTGRDAGVEDRVPMCGVPFHAVNGYIQKLIEKGYKVAIAEQMEDANATKGIVKRDVVQVITPGAFMNQLTDTSNHFIAALGVFDFNYVLAFCDLTTGEMFVETLDKKLYLLENEVLSMQVREMIVSKEVEESTYLNLKEKHNILISYFEDAHLSQKKEEILIKIHDFKQIKTCSLLINYLLETQKRDLDYLQNVQEIKAESYLLMDYHTKAALELTSTLRSQEKYGSLLWLLDKTKTAMGSRLLKQWIHKPLVSKEDIEYRLDIVETFTQNFIERETIKEVLKEVYDLEKLAARVAYGNVNARDLLWIAKSLTLLPELKHQLLSLNHPYINDLVERISDFTSIISLIDNAFLETPPIQIKEGGMFKEGFNQELDEYFDIRKNGKQWILNFLEEEKVKTGIKNLKVGFNKVFGYYIEVTRSYLPLVKDEFNYQRKQSLANAERFITPELKEMESKIVSSQDKIENLEYELFLQIRNSVKEQVDKIQDAAKLLAQIDVYIALATVSSNNQYIRPIFNNQHHLEIHEGRHGVIEEVMKKSNYVENDICMDSEENILLITGPNMGGKSTYMRQIALTVIMAQIGCFVPCRQANLPIFDQLFTRIGASDDLVSGQSTFMVEMLEANHALRNATENSLIIFDEIGRGTATFDGMAIAQSIVEYIAKNIHCITLFSTHYHELTLLEDKITSVKNVHTSVQEKDNQIIFLYKIKDGKANKSYGVNVARLADLPESILGRADSLLVEFEKQDIQPIIQKEEPIISNQQLEIVTYLSKIDPMNLSPIEALSTLVELKKMVKKEA